MRRRRSAAIIAFAAVLLVASFHPVAARAQALDSLPPDLSTRVAAAVNDAMRTTQVPSASVGIVRNGRIVYIAAFGHSRLAPPITATPVMHYAIGSISKQFTVAAVMLLQQEGKLSIDEPVSTWFPELTRASEVTLRNLMSHTSGYEDYAPQDYTIPEWTKPSSADKIVHEWATKPLDFDPGTQYQYSNTNFNIVGLIVQKVSGEPFWQFLESRVLKPLALDHTIDLDTQHDLLKWDVSVIDQTLLAPSSYAAMEAPTTLKNGKISNYGLGLTTGSLDGHRMVSHGGEVGGFVAANYIFPDDSIAVAVLTNQEASPAAAIIGTAIIKLVLPGATPAADVAAQNWARDVLTGLQHGQIDRSRFTANCNFYFDATAIDDYRNSLAPFGAIASIQETSRFDRGGMTFRGFAVEFATGKRVTLSTFTMPDGKIEQFLVEPVS